MTKRHKKRKCGEKIKLHTPRKPEDKDYKDFLNPESLVLAKGYAEPALLDDASGIAVQFERTGYYIKDADSTPEKPVFNRTATLKDSYKPE